MDELNQASQQGNFSLRKLLERKTLVVALCLLLGVFFITGRIFSHRGRGKTDSAKPTAPEERKLYTESDLNQVLQRAEAASIGRKPPMAVLPTQKRNYASEIAVFIFERSGKGPLPRTSSTRPSGKLGLPAGTKIPGNLSGTLFSYNVAAPVTVVVSKNVEKDGQVLIPEASQFLGEAGVLKSLNRINVNFHLLILPDGKQVRVRAMALSEDGSSGIKGRVSKHRDMRVLKAIGETALAGASLFAGGIRSEPYAFEDQLRMNLAQNLTQEARQDLRSVKVETSVTVDSFTPVQVILLEAI